MVHLRLFRNFCSTDKKAIEFRSFFICIDVLLQTLLKLFNEFSIKKEIFY